MAATTLLLIALHNGTSLYLDYDDTTLLATGMTASCGIQALSHFVFYYTAGGVTTSLQCNRGAAARTHTFASPLQGVPVTDPQGNPSIDFGITVFGGGYGTVAPTAVTVI